MIFPYLLGIKIISSQVVPQTMWKVSLLQVRPLPVVGGLSLLQLPMETSIFNSLLKNKGVLYTIELVKYYDDQSARALDEVTNLFSFFLIIQVRAYIIFGLNQRDKQVSSHENFEKNIKISSYIFFVATFSLLLLAGISTMAPRVELHSWYCVQQICPHFLFPHQSWRFGKPQNNPSTSMAESLRTEVSDSRFQFSNFSRHDSEIQRYQWPLHFLNPT